MSSISDTILFLININFMLVESDTIRFLYDTTI